MKVILKRSNRKGKKWHAKIIECNKISNVHFGAKGASDYTKHKNEKRKANYIKRHRKNEDWADPKTAGFWSRWLLWEKKTISQAIKNIEDKFNLDIELKN